MVRIVVLPSEGGRPMSKSMDMYDQGHMGRGNGQSRPAGRFVGVLHWAHSGQAATYSLTSWTRGGHQNLLWTTKHVLEMPEWQEKQEVWHLWMIIAQSLSGTNSLPEGQVDGPGSFSREEQHFLFNGQTGSP